MKQGIIAKIHEINELLTLEDFKNTGLMNGSSGKALFQYYMYDYTKDQSIKKEAYRSLEHTIDHLFENKAYHTYASGIAGVGWLFEHLNQMKFISVDTNDMLEEIDAFLPDYLNFEIERGNYDYLHGALGIGLYFLNRRTFPHSNEMIRHLVNELNKQCINDEIGIRWPTYNVKINEIESSVNFGLAHGIISILMFLNKVYKNGIETSVSLNLIQGVVKYIINKQQDPELFISSFPTTLSNDSNEIPNPSRLGWCYGDLGVIIVLCNILNVISDIRLRNTIVKCLTNCVKRIDLTQNLVWDAGLCHGTSGIALLYNKMYFILRLEGLKMASNYWYNETLKIAKFQDGAAGYKRLYEKNVYKKDFGLIEGIAGIGLSLLAFINVEKTQWTELLLIS